MNGAIASIPISQHDYMILGGVLGAAGTNRGRITWHDLVKVSTGTPLCLVGLTLLYVFKRYNFDVFGTKGATYKFNPREGTRWPFPAPRLEFSFHKVSRRVLSDDY